MKPIRLSDLISDEALTWNIFICHHLTCLKDGPYPERPKGRLRYSNDIHDMYYAYRSN